MSNIYRPDSSIVNDDNMEQSTITDHTHTLNETVRSEIVVDERSIHLNDTNETINDLTAYESTSRRLSIPVDDSNISIGESRSWTEESEFDYVFAANRDEQSNNRIRFPSDDANNIFITFLTAATINLIYNWMLNRIPFGIQDTQPHTLILPVFVNLTPTIDLNINNENGDINEDGTNFNDDDSINEENINTITTETQLDLQLIARESNVEETMDDVDPTTSTNAHNTNDQHEPIMEHENSSNYEENETNLLRGQVSPGADDNEIHDDVPAVTPPIPTTVPSGQVEEIETILNEPNENNNHPGSDPADLLAAGLNMSPLNTQNRKQTNQLNTSENINDMQR